MTEGGGETKGEDPADRKGGGRGRGGTGRNTRTLLLTDELKARQAGRLEHLFERQFEPSCVYVCVCVFFLERQGRADR